MESVRPSVYVTPTELLQTDGVSSSVCPCYSNLLVWRDLRGEDSSFPVIRFIRVLPSFMGAVTSVMSFQPTTTSKHGACSLEWSSCLISESGTFHSLKWAWYCKRPFVIWTEVSRVTRQELLVFGDQLESFPNQILFTESVDEGYGCSPKVNQTS